jgi:hypothetical protein
VGAGRRAGAGVSVAGDVVAASAGFGAAAGSAPSAASGASAAAAGSAVSIVSPAVAPSADGVAAAGALVAAGDVAAVGALVAADVAAGAGVVAGADVTAGAGVAGVLIEGAAGEGWLVGVAVASAGAAAAAGAVAAVGAAGVVGSAAGVVFFDSAGSSATATAPTACFGAWSAAGALAPGSGVGPLVFCSVKWMILLSMYLPRARERLGRLPEPLNSISWSVLLRRGPLLRGRGWEALHLSTR